MFGRNEQHKMFGEKVKAAGAEMKKGSPGASSGMGGEGKPEGGEGKGEMGKTEITHHEDGSHTVMHHDGEETHHPTTGHAMLAIHAKHEPGPAHLAHAHESGVRTHHVGHDGEPQGPEEHPDAESAAAEMPGKLGEDGGMMDSADGSMPEMAGSGGSAWG